MVGKHNCRPTTGLSKLLLQGAIGSITVQIFLNTFQTCAFQGHVRPLSGLLRNLFSCTWTVSFSFLLLVLNLCRLSHSLILAPSSQLRKNSLNSDSTLANKRTAPFLANSPVNSDFISHAKPSDAHDRISYCIYCIQKTFFLYVEHS